MAKSKFKKIVGWLHLWIGLVTGIVIFIVSITGCIYTFDQEIFDWVHRDIVYVEPENTVRPLSELLEKAKHSLGAEKIIDGVQITSPEKAYVFTATRVNDVANINLSAFSQYAYQDQVYINQYTGQVLGVMDMRYEFFHVVELLHRQLLLVKPVGSVIVGGFTLIFLIAVLTGLILWIPKNYKQLKRNLQIKFSAKWKRINYDLHNSVGFYVIPFAILFVITGLVWSFRWWELGMYKMLGEKERPSFFRTLPPFQGQDSTLNKTDVIYTELLSQLEGTPWRQIGIVFPTEENKSVLTVVITNNNDGWRGMNYYYFDGRTGKLFDALLQHNKSLGIKWRNSNLEIHTGRIYGWPTQILAFVASLICATLPITGFLIWWNKRRKHLRKKPPYRSGNSILSAY
ncbi:PepSY-associated TM helix domain-containing protein [Sphingobacterium populi]|uniref:PepSY-associated TM helix domain-containing protein n=1 Tax=Sphingobacterium populi TaxID=1812824 RepID=A0ABW5UH07_9SPHI